MYQILITLIAIFLIIEILLFPQEAMSHAATGLTLWLENMIPALFPFMVISGLIVRLNLVPLIVKIIHPVLNAIFRTNIYCEYAMVMGFLCGYPMGAVIIKDLLEDNKINTKEANYLLSFCNNVGPVFYCSLVLPVFESKYHIMLLLGMYGIPLLYGFFLRYTFYRKTFIRVKKTSPAVTAEKHTFSQAFTAALNQAVSSSLLLGACMIFFNMLMFLPMHYLNDNLLLSSIISWLLEVNGALFHTRELYKMGLHITSLLLIPFLTIGGLSCFCQTAAILSDHKCSLLKYNLHKIVQWFLWLVLTLLWLLFDNLQMFYVLFDGA